MKKHMIAMAALLMVAGCTVSKDRATEIVEAQGYTNVRLGGPSLWGCSEDDSLTRTFTATAVNGSRVEGVVCAGLFFKGATVRVERVIAPAQPKLQTANLVLV